jgi:hypothetical protein
MLLGFSEQRIEERARLGANGGCFCEAENAAGCSMHLRQGGYCTAARRDLLLININNSVSFELDRANFNA